MEDHTSNEASNKLKVVMFPWFAYGHINPFVQLANKLSTHGIQISFLSIPGNISRIKSSLKHPKLTQIIPINIPSVDGLSKDFDSSSDVTPETSELLKIALDKMQPQVKPILAQFQPNIVIFDFVQFWLPKLASEMGIKAVEFSVFPAVASSYVFHPSRVPPSVDKLRKPPVGFPNTVTTSMKTFEARNNQYLLFTSFHGGPPAFERVMEVLTTCDAIIYKSCSEIEGLYIDYLTSQLKKPILLAGTLPAPPSDAFDPKWENWLSTFPEKSVIFCNFGSEAHLSNSQIEELTLGLELTGMPFFLVLNFSVNNASERRAKLEAVLPDGFQERVKDRGVVHTGWVQQQHILAHNSVGCHINHSGFSSVIEAIVNDCQLVCVPQFGDQFLRSRLFCDDLKVGIEVRRRDEDGFFAKCDVVEAVKAVVVDIDVEPGVCVRANHKKLRKFLLDKEVEEEYIVNLIKALENLANS